MTGSYLLVKWLHVLVMGYWIGSDLIINPLSYFVARSQGMAGRERGRLWDFLMDVDQHPRNAMILSVPLGLTLAAHLGLAPITGAWLLLAWVLSAAWFAQMWLTHLKGASPVRARLRVWDWRIRYIIIVACVASALASFLTGFPFAAHWLAAKVLLFAGVIACGLGIRHYIREYLAVWPKAVNDAALPADEAKLRFSMHRGRQVLVLLHFQLLVIGLLGVFKPF